MKIKNLLPLIAILPAALFAFKAADVRKSEKSFRKVEVIQDLKSANAVGEGKVAATSSVNISTDFSDGKTSVRTVETSAAITRFGLQNDLVYTDNVVAMHE